MGVRPDRAFISTGNRPPNDGEIKELKKSNTYHYLIGLVQRYYTVIAPDEWVTKSELKAGDINTGVAIVVPFIRISETIDAIAHDEMAEK
jgi:hypothetical protein